MTAKQRAAVDLLKRCAGHDNGWGVVTSSESASIDGQAWIHWRTALALERRGFVEIDRSYGRDGWLLCLTAASQGRRGAFRGGGECRSPPICT